VNNVSLIGRLARDPEAKEISSGQIAEFTIAVDRRKGRGGEEQEPHWFRVTAFGQTADYVLQYVGKGQRVAISGRLEHRKYQDRDGNNREAISIVADNVQGLDRPREDDVKPTQGRRARPSPADVDPLEDD
jgi:single-strand DNA-binding protein